MPAVRQRLVVGGALGFALVAGAGLGAVGATFSSPEPPPVNAAAPPPTTIPASPEPSAPPFPPIRMVVGEAYTDSTGQVWTAESGSVGGSVSGTGDPIGRTPDPRLYQAIRWGMQGYDIPVGRPGRYRVTLHTVETYFDSAGKRVFNITAEGKPEVSNLDVFAASGGKNTAMRVSFDTVVVDGVLQLGFSAIANEPAVSALAVERLAEVTAEDLE